MSQQQLKIIDGRYFPKEELEKRLNLMGINLEEHILKSKSDFIETYNKYIHNPVFQQHIRSLLNFDKERESNPPSQSKSNKSKKPFLGRKRKNLRNKRKYLRGQKTQKSVASTAPTIIPKVTLKSTKISIPSETGKLRKTSREKSPEVDLAGAGSNIKDKGSALLRENKDNKHFYTYSSKPLESEKQKTFYSEKIGSSKRFSHSRKQSREENPEKPTIIKTEKSATSNYGFENTEKKEELTTSNKRIYEVIFSNTNLSLNESNTRSKTKDIKQLSPTKYTKIVQKLIDITDHPKRIRMIKKDNLKKNSKIKQENQPKPKTQEIVPDYNIKTLQLPTQAPPQIKPPEEVKKPQKTVTHQVKCQKINIKPITTTFDNDDIRTGKEFTLGKQTFTTRNKHHHEKFEKLSQRKKSKEKKETAVKNLINIDKGSETKVKTQSFKGSKLNSPQEEEKKDNKINKIPLAELVKINEEKGPQDINLTKPKEVADTGKTADKSIQENEPLKEQVNVEAKLNPPKTPREFNKTPETSKFEETKQKDKIDASNIIKEKSVESASMDIVVESEKEEDIGDSKYIQQPLDFSQIEQSKTTQIPLEYYQQPISFGNNSVSKPFGGNYDALNQIQQPYPTEENPGNFKFPEDKPNEEDNSSSIDSDIDMNQFNINRNPTLSEKFPNNFFFRDFTCIEGLSPWFLVKAGLSASAIAMLCYLLSNHELKVQIFDLIKNALVGFNIDLSPYSLKNTAIFTALVALIFYLLIFATKRHLNTRTAIKDYNMLIEISNNIDFPNEDDFILSEENIIKRLAERSNMEPSAYVCDIYPLVKEIIIEEEYFYFEKLDNEFYLKLIPGCREKSQFEEAFEGNKKQPYEKV